MARQSLPLTSLIIEMLQQKHLLTAPHILEQLQSRGIKYNKTSLYRALDKLLAENTICKLNFGDNDIQYELRATHHDHLVCLKCGKIASAKCGIQPRHDIDGFLVDHHHITYFGMCIECQKKQV